MSRNPVVEAVSAMPFAGRHAIRPVFLWAREGARNGNLTHKLGGVIFLGAMVVAHVNQMRLGIDATITHAERGSVWDIAQAGYDSLYATANAAVSYTQSVLGAKLLRTSNRETVPVGVSEAANGAVFQASALEQPQPTVSEGQHTSDHHPERSFGPKNYAVDFACTLGAQALFLATQQTM